MTEIATTFLSKLEAQYASQIEEIKAESVNASVEIAQGKNIAARKKAYKKAIAELDVELLSKVEDAMTGYLDNLLTVDFTTPRALEATEATTLMGEYKRLAPISEFLAARRETMKDIVFSSLDETVGEFTNGEIRVPELGKMFRREGAGKPAPELDLELLIEALDPADAAKIVKTTTIPEHTVVVPETTVTELDEEALLNLIQSNPETMQLLKNAIKASTPKAGKFIVRDIPAE